MMLLRVKAKRLLINFIMLSIVFLTVYQASFLSYASEVIGTAKVTADSLNVRSGPGKEYDTMGKLYSGNVVDVKAVEGDWLKIDYNSSDGYISIDYVEYEPDEELLIEEEEEAVKEEATETNDDDTAETEDEPSFDYKFLFGLIGAIIVILIMILITIKSIKASDDYDDDDDD
ncbi:MAG: SH3 domain-containing protein, partial [Lachnospiraceae bacterium]|nr:SH3 domain-containing protein [Lachnospiraceae bacterium]